MQTPDFDMTAAHRFFAAHFFNQTWEFMKASDRSPAEADRLIAVCQASFWHWTQRPDCTPRNLAIGYWQLARVYALVKEGENARKYAERCREYSEAEGPFYLGYAYEALARAAQVQGDVEAQNAFRQQAQLLAEQVPEAEDRQILLSDLETL